MWQLQDRTYKQTIFQNIIKTEYEFVSLSYAIAEMRLNITMNNRRK